MPYYKPKKGERDGTPTITVPRTLTQITYFNVPLAMMLAERGFDKVHYDIDKEGKQIVIRQPQEDEKGYRVLKTGLRGFGITPRFRKSLPAGRYRLVKERKAGLVFARA